MSNFAAIIAPLAISGSRKSDGSVNAGGKVYAYLPGTLTTTSIYANADASTIATQPITLDNGGRVSRSDYPDGLFTVRPIRLLIQDSAGTTISDSVYVPSTAGATGVDNDGFTDATLDDVLSDAYTSFGGTDWRYLESGGATARTIKAKFAEISISVKDFGAVGDGVAIDTTAVQAAMNRVKALGGGVCYFPPGTYVIDQALTLSSATGVRMVGAGSRASLIATSSATANTFTLSSCTSCTFENLRIAPAGANSGAGIALSSSTDVVINQVTMKSGHDYGIDVTASNMFVSDSGIVSAAKAIRFQSSVTISVIRGCVLNSDTNIELQSTSQNIHVIACHYLPGTTCVLFNANLTGTKFTFSHSPTLGTASTPFTVNTATLPVYRQWGNNLDAYATAGAVGGTQTPILYKGDEQLLSATGGGAGTVTVAAPAILPGTSTLDVNLHWDFVFKNASGGAVTWDVTTAGVYVVAAAIPTTDGHTISVRFRWDRATGDLRECSRADTVT